MGRNCDLDLEPILNGAETWKQRCLLGDGSIFSDESLWTAETLTEFKRLYIDRPDLGDGSFIEKFETQLAEGSPEVKKLAAEMDWFYCLFPFQAISQAKKISEVRKIWSWSGEALSEDHPMLSAFAKGVGHPGRAYLTLKWREFVYLGATFLAWRNLGRETRETLLGDPWQFSNWLDSQEGSDKRISRSVICFLLFPDYFERMASRQHKKKVQAAYSALPSPQLEPLLPEDSSSATREDYRIYQIRAALEEREGSKIDFYSTEGLRDEWDIKPAKPLAKPFKNLFTDQVEAHWWFDFMGEVFECLEIPDASSGERLVALTLQPSNAPNRINLSYGPWLICSLLKASETNQRAELAFLEELVPQSADADRWDPFATKEEEKGAILAGVSLEELQDPESGVKAAYFQTLAEVLRRYGHRKGTSYAKAHQSDLMDMVFDEEIRGEYLTNGLPARVREESDAFRSITEGVTQQHVMAALAEIDREGVPDRAQSSTYDLIHGERRYPPKLVLSWAVKQATGEEFDRGLFDGGEESKCFKLLRGLGFSIEKKTAMQELVQKFISQADEEESLVTRNYASEYRGLKVKVGFGQGTFARVPWVSFCGEAQTTSNGIYPCLLYFKSARLLLLTKCISETNQPEKKWSNVEDAETVKEFFQARGEGLPERYGTSYVFSSYDLAGTLDVDKVAHDLDRLIAEYETKVGAGTTANEIMIVEREIDDFAISQVDDIFSDSSFLCSLLTKPFTILTGGSGTGKTKLAEALASHLRNAENEGDATNSAVVAVGADWTDNRNVLGYVNHLRPDGNPVFQSTPVLDLLLEALKPGNEATPFFLVLDEMNLSHVERYFADFLSVMEQRNGSFKLHGEGGDGGAGFKLPNSDSGKPGVPQSLPYPPNLFVIGTVNVDETTYMFSPKVLDRANVIEFAVKKGEIKSFLESPHEYKFPDKALDGVAEAFRALAVQARSGELDPLPDEPGEKVRKHLVALFSILKKGRFEFAYRTANEVSRYLQVCRHLAEDQEAWDTGGWVEDLDDQILQKILPKLHGSIGRVGSLLGALAEYCGGKSEQEVAQWFPKDGAAPPMLQSALKKPESQEHTPFGKSAKKLRSMIRVLQDEQFVSFIN